MWKVLGAVMVLVACGPMPVEPSPECGPSTCSGCCTGSGRCVGSGSATCGVGGQRCAVCGSGASCVSGQCVNAVMPALIVDAGPVDAGVRDLDAGPTRMDAGEARDAGVPDAGQVCPRSMVMPENQAINGDLECAGLLPFQSSGGGGRVDAIPGRTGRAVRFTVAAGLFNNEFTSTWRFQVRQAGTWCARAFVKGTASVISMRLYLGPPGTAAGEVFDLPGPVSAWSRLPPTLTAVNATGQVGDEGFVVFLDRTHTAGATIEVDDVDVWRSADGQCRDSR
jgi:hypothetical protein